MNKKGFTLVELMAVLVILSVLILLIAPLVFKTINNSKEKLLIQNGKFYIKGVELALKELELDGILVEDGTYLIMSDGNICLSDLEDNACPNDKILKIKSEGDKPIEGSVTLVSSEVINHRFKYSSGLTLVDGEINENLELASGLYDEDDNLIYTWDELIDKDIIKVTNGVVTKSTNSSLLVGKLVIDDNISSIGQAAFRDCDSLTGVTIPDSVTSIENWAFSYCESLTSITIPDSVTSIENWAFSYCTSLTSVVIGKGLISIGTNPFNSCSQLSIIKVDTSNNVFDSRNNSNAIIKTSTNELLVGCKDTKILSGIMSIGIEAFDGCIGLTSITIPSSVISIGDSSFEDCVNLRNINYTGTQSQWNNINFHTSWSNNINLTINYNYTG